MEFQRNEEKNRKLLEERKICFEDIVDAIAAWNLLFDKAHPNREKYPHQYVMLVSVDAYPYIVPYVRRENIYFLKTIYPSRTYKSHLAH